MSATCRPLWAAGGRLAFIDIRGCNKARSNGRTPIKSSPSLLLKGGATNNPFSPTRGGTPCPEPKDRTLLHRKFQQLLHDYKVNLFHGEHNNVKELTDECMAITEDVLNQKYHYHFHKLPDADRAEIINMINNYTREAILPPVVEKLVERQVANERRVIALEKLLEQILENLSIEAPVV